MGFFSTIARKLVNKTDSEAVRLIARAQQGQSGVAFETVPTDRVSDGALPPPRRIEKPGTYADPPPTVLPKPDRIPINIGLPPGQHEYNLGQMEESLRAQPIPNLTNATVSPGGEIVGGTYPTRAPALPPPTRVVPTTGMPEGPAAGPLGEQIQPPTMVGQSYQGMRPAQRAATRLQVLQGASPMSKVRDTGTAYEELPPETPSRLRAMGQGFARFMGYGARNGIGGMIGSGIVGAGIGLVSPNRIQRIGREQEISQAEAGLDRAQGLEAQGLQNDTRRLGNMRAAIDLGRADEDRDLELTREQRLEWTQGLSNLGDMQKAQSLLDPQSQQYAAAESAIQQEAARLSRRTGRNVTVIPGNPRLNQLPRFEVDGQIVQQQHDGTWKPVYGKSRSADQDAEADLKAQYDWQVKNSENEGKRIAALAEAQALETTATDHQKKVTALAGQITMLDAQMAQMSTRDPALGPLKRQRAQLERTLAEQERQMNAAYEKANERKAEASKYPTLPAPPRRSRQAGQPSGPGGKSLSERAWKTANPGGDWNAAVKEAERRQIPIIP